MLIRKLFKFENAHIVRGCSTERCKYSIHGHSYKVTVRALGPIDAHTGWVMDLSDISLKFEPLRRLVDHTLLNNIKGLENPTTENICLWILRAIAETLPEISSVSVSSTDRISVTITKKQAGL